MFTGLIETTGTVLALIRNGAAITSSSPATGDPTSGPTRITIAAPTLAARLAPGDSIAVSGVCLTALDIEPLAFPPRFSADLAAETLTRTTLGNLAPGALVNLELPTPAGSPLGGHIVQGHVDATATLLALAPITPGSLQTDWRLTLEVPESLTRHIVSQGSITVEGISLTVAALHGRQVEIAVIPHTYAATSLHTLTPGAPLNIETDILAKYAARHSTPTTPQPALTEAFLIANGY